MRELILVEDYHEIQYIANSFSELTEGIELGLTTSKRFTLHIYAGLLYRGNKPDDLEIQEILSVNGISLTNNKKEEIT